MFRKAALLEVNGYDTDTVGEDMELVLRFQDNHGKRSTHRIVYDSDAMCFTGVPHNLKRLLHQRDRWQRGLLDCLMKHHNMIANPVFGLLGLLTMIYQLIVELLGPVFWCIYVVLLILEEAISLFSMVFFGYLLFIADTDDYICSCKRYYRRVGKIITKVNHYNIGGYAHADSHHNCKNDWNDYFLLEKACMVKYARKDKSENTRYMLLFEMIKK